MAKKSSNKQTNPPFPNRDFVINSLDNYTSLTKLIDSKDYKYLLSPLLSLTEKFFEVISQNSKNNDIKIKEIQKIRNSLSHYFYIPEFNIIECSLIKIKIHLKKLLEKSNNKQNADAKIAKTILIKEYKKNDFITIFLYLMYS